jgi:hypothetical protein
MELEGLHWNEIYSDIRRATLGRNFNITIGRAACEACSATWNLGTNSAFAQGPRKTLIELPGRRTFRRRRSTFFYITYINLVRTSQEAQYISVV